MNLRKITYFPETGRSLAVIAVQFDLPEGAVPRVGAESCHALADHPDYHIILWSHPDYPEGMGVFACWKPFSSAFAHSPEARSLLRAEALWEEATQWDPKI